MAYRATTLSRSKFGVKFLVRLSTSLGVSALFAYFSLRHTSLAAVARAMGAADAAPIWGYTAILLVVHAVKTWRWGILLRSAGEVGMRRLNAASAVGFMLMVTLPLRLGELARPLLVAQPTRAGEQRLARSRCLASVAVERIVDSLAMGVLGVIALQVLAPKGENGELARLGAWVVTVGFSGVVIALVFAYFMRAQAAALTERLVARFSPKLGRKLGHALESMLDALHLGSVQRVMTFLALTGLYWSLHVWGFWWLASGFGVQLSLMMAATVLAFQVIGIMIPAGPGMVGTSQFFTQLGVAVCLPAFAATTDGVSRVAGYANMIWLLQFSQQVLTGLLFLALGHISFRALLARWDGPDVDVEPARVGG